ncbi:Imm10 family immunity protein [Streptomyces sp. NPDC001982]|uniref:Imm10 family immunity protein n=1 Tax=Streptomyces sp. NPDC001982 TaxID=3154405 RepID=UPI0033311781
MFMAGEEEPDDQEVALGMETHCLVTAGQGTAYGCVREAVLTGNVLRVALSPDSLDDLRLNDSVIEAVIEAPAEDIVQFREVLAQVLNYGRADAVPSRIAV